MAEKKAKEERQAVAKGWEKRLKTKELLPRKKKRIEAEKKTEDDRQVTAKQAESERILLRRKQRRRELK